MVHGIFDISTKIIVDVDGSLSKLCRRQKFFVKPMSTSTGCCWRSVDVDKVSTSSCGRQPAFKKVPAATCRRRRNLDKSPPKTCRRPSTSTCRRRQGFDKKVQGFTFSATWGECRQACRRRQRWRRERNFFDKDGEGRRCRRQQALVDGLSTSTSAWRCQSRRTWADMLHFGSNL